MNFTNIRSYAHRSAAVALSCAMALQMTPTATGAVSFIGAAADTLSTEKIRENAAENTSDDVLKEAVQSVATVSFITASNIDNDLLMSANEYQLAQRYFGEDEGDMETDVHTAPDNENDCPMPAEHQEYLRNICEEYGVDYGLAQAVIYVESGYDAGAVSESGDYGYMQVNEINYGWLYDELGTTDLLNPFQNMQAGVYILKLFFERYGDVNKVLMAYNCGPGVAEELWERGICSSEYTENVVNHPDLWLMP